MIPVYIWEIWWRISLTQQILLRVSPLWARQYSRHWKYCTKQHTKKPAFMERASANETCCGEIPIREEGEGVGGGTVLNRVVGEGLTQRDNWLETWKEMRAQTADLQGKNAPVRRNRDAVAYGKPQPRMVKGQQGSQRLASGPRVGRVGMEVREVMGQEFKGPFRRHQDLGLCFERGGNHWRIWGRKSACWDLTC